MARTTPLSVGTPEWFAWLAGTGAFAFAGPPGIFAACHEPVGHGRGGRYWRAYRKVGGRLHRVYLGRSEDLTLARLEAAAVSLAALTASAEPSASPKVGGGTPLPAPLTSFIGRADEVAIVQRLLAGRSRGRRRRGRRPVHQRGRRCRPPFRRQRANVELSAGAPVSPDTAG